MALITLTVGMVPSIPNRRSEPQADVAPTPNGRGANPKPTWRQTQIHANYFQ
jgi:hypothetical protein